VTECRRCRVLFILDCKTCLSPFLLVAMCNTSSFGRLPRQLSNSHDDGKSVWLPIDNNSNRLEKRHENG
jgi:hypothetical protein